jgi:predicted nucleic acid-binding protein
MELGTSVYDAVYLVLARRNDARLVTADRRLAALAGRAELVE